MRRYFLLFTLIPLIFSCRPITELEQELEFQDQKLMLWNFPLPRTHTGALIGNGVQGLMIWGGGNQLNVTIGRAGFWDRRGGKDFLKNTTYKEVRNLLYNNNQTGLIEAFGIDSEPEPGVPARPHQIGGGRLEIEFADDWNLERGVLDLNYGTFEITVKHPELGVEIVRIRQSTFLEAGAITLSKILNDGVKVRLIPSWEHVKDQLEPVGVQPPIVWEDEKEDSPSIHGFVQHLPEDEPLAIAYKRTENNRIVFASSVDPQAKEKVIASMRDIPVTQILEDGIEWWDQYWADVPTVKLPDPFLQEIWNYGLYKQAISTPEHGIACSLQGPFNEEYQLPPWSNDYHYNINIEMIYMPVLGTNRTNHLMPVWEMVQNMMPQLKENGEHFFGREGALMLPHAVDDEGTVVGTFWTGTIDHACTAWMAQLAWLHYRYTMNEEILTNVAWPLLVGAFEGYWAMMKTTDLGGKKALSLPVSVSPEFKGSRLDAWGRDASFQLAAAHMIAEIMPNAAKLLGKEIDPRWAQVTEELPKYTTVEASQSLESPERQVERIALWEGMDLVESHRHHSHMAGIYPFDVIDPIDPDTRHIVRATYDNWVRKGPGVWSGWCVPWASILHNRNQEPEAAVSWLRFWYDTFINEGRGTLHDAAFKGTSMISSDWSDVDEISVNREKMQLDAGFGALSAVMDLLVYQKRGTVYVLPKIHRDWKQFSFSGIAVEGGFLISAEVAQNQTQSITIQSKFGGPIRLAHGLGDRFKLGEEIVENSILEREFDAGESVVLTRVD